MDADTQVTHIVKRAQEWVGTPYRHQGSAKGVGCDCLGLVRGIWRELYGDEPEIAGPYSMDWADTSVDDRLLHAARRHFVAIDQLSLGCLIVFRWRSQMPAKHVGIYVGDNRFIHAYERAAVISSALVPQWKKRIAGLFEFPRMNGER
jgi:NlpC/P60 family putative phage cell wall peptidase